MYDQGAETTSQAIDFVVPFASKDVSPYEFYCTDVPLVQSFMPPVEEHKIEFVSIIFVI